MHAGLGFRNVVHRAEPSRATDASQLKTEFREPNLRSVFRLFPFYRVACSDFASLAAVRPDGGFFFSHHPSLLSFCFGRFRSFRSVPLLVLGSLLSRVTESRVSRLCAPPFARGYSFPFGSSDRLSHSSHLCEEIETRPFSLSYVSYSYTRTRPRTSGSSALR